MTNYESSVNKNNYIAKPVQALREALAQLIMKEKEFAKYSTKDKEGYEVLVELKHYDDMISQYEEAIRVLENQYSPQIFIPNDDKEDK